jgi:photoactive yellow protein
MALTFDQPDLLSAVAEADDAALDAVDFGIVAMDKTGQVTRYNATESRSSGLGHDRVIGRDFFTVVAPCTNNFMVAQRFQDEDVLDEQIDYVFTLRMAPTPVRLRMLKSPVHDEMVLAVRWQGA